MGYTVPLTAVAAAKLTSAQWNASVRDNILFLANPPACRVRNIASTSVADSSTPILTFDTERYDTDGMHSTSLDTDRITFNTAGLYLVTLSGRFATATDYLSAFASIQHSDLTVLAKDSAGTFTDNGIDLDLSVATVYKFAVAEYVLAKVGQNNGANAARNFSGAEFSATWLGLG